MTTYKKRPDFTTSEEGLRVAKVLSLMVLDKRYMTKPGFSLDSEKYADNLIPFIDMHLAYLQNHPATNLEHYLSNLKLRTRIRG